MSQDPVINKIEELTRELKHVIELRDICFERIKTMIIWTGGHGSSLGTLSKVEIVTEVMAAVRNARKIKSVILQIRKIRKIYGVKWTRFTPDELLRKDHLL